MEPKSKVRKLSKAPAEMRRPGSHKRGSGAIARLMVGSVLSLGATVVLSDEAQASGLLEHREHRPSSTFRAAAHFPKVSGETKARIPDESVEGQSKIARPAELIEVASSQSASIEEVGSQPQESQDEVVFVPAAPKPYAGRSSNVRVKKAYGNGGFDIPTRNTPRSTLPVFGDILGRPRLSWPMLMLGDHRAYGSASGHGLGFVRASLEALDEPLVVSSDLSGAAQVMPSYVPLVSLSFAKLYEGVVPVVHKTGTDTIAVSGSLIPLGVQVSAQTDPEAVDDPDATRRVGGFALGVSTIVGFETNPFLINSPDTGTASLRLILSPTFSRQGALGDLRISARLEQIEYTGNYDAVQNVAANLASRMILNERLTGIIDLSFDRGVLVTNLGGLGPIDGVPDEVGPLPGGGDITLLGLNQRRSQYQAVGGLRLQLSERDELEASMSFRADRFGRQDRQELQETNFLSGRMSYARQVSSGLAIGVVVDARRIDFVEQSLGGITTISPQATMEFAFSPNWELAGSLGVARIRSNTEFSQETSTAAVGEVSICRSGVRANFCLTGARQVVPFGIGGGGLQSNVGTSYSFRPSERETFSLSADYGEASETLLPGGRTIKTIGASLRYEFELSERFLLSAESRYTGLGGDTGPNVSNFQALVGLTITLGRAQ